MILRTSGEATGVGGVYASERLSFICFGKASRESQGQNRNREIRPSGIAGGPGKRDFVDFMAKCSRLGSIPTRPRHSFHATSLSAALHRRSRSS